MKRLKIVSVFVPHQIMAVILSFSTASTDHLSELVSCRLVSRTWNQAFQICSSLCAQLAKLRIQNIYAWREILKNPELDSLPLKELPVQGGSVLEHIEDPFAFASMIMPFKMSQKKRTIYDKLKDALTTDYQKALEKHALKQGLKQGLDSVAVRKELLELMKSSKNTQKDEYDAFKQLIRGLTVTFIYVDRDIEYEESVDWSFSLHFEIKIDGIGT